MSKVRKDYVLAVQAPARSLGNGSFDTESAFALHLKALRADLGSDFERLVLLAPEIPEDIHERNRAAYGRISEDQDGIAFVPIYEDGATPLQFWTKHALPLWRRLGDLLSNAGYVHSGLEENIWAPYMALVNVRAWMKGLPSTFVIDIDFRQMSYRFWRTGVWSRKSYIVNRLLHDPFKHLQVWLAVRSSKLVLLKSPSMVAAYGAGRPHVKDFLDAAHSAEDVVSDESLETRLSQRAGGKRPLEVIYFGRFVPYKGLDLVLEAVARAIAQGANVRLTLVGSGECLEGLREQSASLGLDHAVAFLPAVPYGPRLFEIVDRADVAIAAPKIEDTPRAALDAMARGVPIVAFDIDYFKNLAEKSGAVALAQWPSPASLGEQLVKLEQDRPAVARMARKGVAFARANTQEIWLDRRTKWTKAAIHGANMSPAYD